MAHGPLSHCAFLLHMGRGTHVSALRHAAASPERADMLGEAAAKLADAVRMGKEVKTSGRDGWSSERCGY